MAYDDALSGASSASILLVSRKTLREVGIVFTAFLRVDELVEGAFRQDI